MRPEQTKLALTLADGSLAVMSFVTRGFTPNGAVQFERELSEASVRAECAKAGLALVSWRAITDEDLPATREYRGAWCDRGGRIGHDMPKARDIHRQKLRVERVGRLAKLDVEYQRADEAGDKKAKQTIAKAKQALRDAPADPRIEAARTVDELKDIGLD